MKKIYLLSHCSASGQHKDSPLTTEGTRQAQLLSIYFIKNKIPIDKIISSSYFRAIESIQPYSDKSGIKIELDDRLHEFILSNEPVEDWIEAIERSFADANYHLPGGESANEAVKRANKVLEEIYQNPDFSNVILVTHRNLLSLILKEYDDSFTFDKWKELNHPDIHLITYENGIKSIERLSIY